MTNEIFVCYEEGVNIDFLSDFRKTCLKTNFVQRPSQLAEQGVPLLKTVYFLLEKGKCQEGYPISVQSLGYPMMKSVYHEMALYSQIIHKTDIVDSVRQDQSIFYTHNGKTLESLTPGDYRHERNMVFRRVGGLRMYSRDFIKSHKTEDIRRCNRS